MSDNEAESGPAFLALSTNGLPSKEALETLSIELWMEWLDQRSLQVDLFTRQVLSGEANPYLLVHDSVVRANNVVQLRFVEAALQLIHDNLLRLPIDDSNDEVEQVHAFRVLVGIVELLMLLPREIVESCGALHARIDDLYEIGIRSPRYIFRRPEYERLMQASVRFLSFFSNKLTNEDLLRFLDDPRVARQAIELLPLEPTAKQVDIFCRFARSYLKINKPIVIDLEVKHIRDQIGVSDARWFVGACLKQLSEQERDLLESMSTIHELVYSPMLNCLKENPKLFYTNRDSYHIYSPIQDSEQSQQITSPPTWIWNVFQQLVNLTKRELNKNVTFHARPAMLTPERQARTSVRYPIVPLEPQFLIPERANDIMVVPYGFVPDLAVVYDKGISKLHKDTIKSWTTIDDILKHDCTVVTVEGTAATEELDDIFHRLGIDMSMKAYLDAKAIAQDLFYHQHAIDRRFALVDIWYYDSLCHYFDEFQPDSINSPASHKRHLQYHRIPYRNPVLVGIPFNKNDRYWGRLIKAALMSVLYTDESNVRATLEQNGIIILKLEEIHKWCEKAKKPFIPWVQVDEEFYPFKVNSIIAGEEIDQLPKAEVID